MVVLKPTVYVDNKLVIHKGQPLVDFQLRYDLK
jgi:hypothetical protein